VAYQDTLSSTAQANAAILAQRIAAAGITNPFTQAAILAVVSKESGFIPQSENLNYTAPRLSQVFGLPPNVAQTLAGNPQATANVVYMPPHNTQLGNTAVGDGYLYRGRGFNQLTGKSNYAISGSKIGQDLLGNPDLLNDPTVASDSAIQFFKDGITALKNSGKLQAYNANDINDFKTADDALGAIYNVNAGVGQTKAFIDADVTGGKRAATSRMADLLAYVQSGVTAGVNSGVAAVKKHPYITIAITAGAIVGVYFLISMLSSKKQ
jgi:putative chitinase